MRGNGISVLIAALALMVTAAPAPAEVTIQDPGTYVVDRAGIIDDRVEQQLEGWLRELEQKTTAQVKVLTVPTIDGEDIFGFAQRHAELWKLGRKGKDNGVLIVLALKERKDRIQVGYGLEALLPDSWCGTLRRKAFVPHFKRGQFSEGLYLGTVAVANKIADSTNVTLTGIPQYRIRRSRVPRGAAACGGGFLPLMIMMIVFSSMSRRRRHHGRWGGGGMLQGLMLGGLMGSMMGGRGHSHWGGGFGSGFGGGGFGGSFGGGGGFGGGGAGGGW